MQRGRTIRRKHDRMKRLKGKRRAGVYFIEFEQGVKIGLTTNLHRRIKEYRKPWHQTIKNIWFLETIHYKIIEKNLKELYQMFSNGSIEFFDLSVKDRVILSMNYQQSLYTIKTETSKANEVKLVYNLTSKFDQLNLFVE